MTNFAGLIVIVVAILGALYVTRLIMLEIKLTRELKELQQKADEHMGREL